MEGGEARIVAYTKVFAIRARLDKRVRYITDGEKTSLASSITYISNPEKTEQFFFTSVLNCSSVDTALSEMMETKQQFGKMGGVLGYHFIQSFQPGEVTPEQAHAVGLEFAKRLFGKRYEVVISTHLNKHHLHNHLVVNSVSCIDGQKYHSSPESYYNDVRGTSDALCRENDLSVITPQGKGKHYAEWKAEQGGKPTVRGVIRADIDAIIHQAYTYDTFLMLLRKNGYEVRRSSNRKYTTVKPPGAKRAIRLDSLGEGYTEADILLRLSRQRHGGMAPLIIAHTVKRYRMKGKLSTVRKKKITGFHALYLRYLYLLRGNKRKKLPPKLPFSVKREVIHLERYEQQFKYLLSSGITTETELEQRIRVLEWDIRLLEEQRKPLYHFNRNQIAALDELLEQRDLLLELIEDVYSVSGDTASLIRGLPEDLSPEREAVVRTACSLVGKVNYFWGGKSLVIGWDARWGELRQVTAAGSSTTGTYRPYGLDCSGFVDWVFYNQSGGSYVIGHGGGATMQHSYCTDISWADAQPGDLVFYPDNSHVGIVGGRDANGELLIIHCASGYNNVVITGKDGFTSVGRPQYYGE